MTVSALWLNSGIVHLLLDNKILSSSDQFREAIFPGLLAISSAFFVIGCVGTLHKKGPLPLMAFALGLANIHVLAFFNDKTLGPSGIACNFMIVTVISIYLVAMRLLNILKNKTAFQKQISVSSTNCISRNHLIVTGIIANMVSSSVLCGKLIGTTNIFFIGQAHWMFTSAMYQVMVSVASFWACDIFHAIFFSFLAVLRFAEGISLINQPHLSNAPLLPLPFMVVFAILFFALGCIMSLQNLYIGVYMLLFAVYCATLTLPSGISHIAPQAVNLIIFLASIVYMLTRLYVSKTDFKVSQRNSLREIIFSWLRYLRIKPPKITCCYFSANFYLHGVDVIGHAFDTLAAFLITVETHASFILLMVTGGMVYITGLFSLSTGKTCEGSAFIFYGIWWIIWGLMKYVTLCLSVIRFQVAVGIVCFFILNAFLTVCLITLNKAWFIKSLTFEILLINVLLHTLDILPGETTVAFSILFGIVSFYCFLACLLNGTEVAPHLPWGEPFLKQGLPLQGRMLCPLPAQKVTSINTIAVALKDITHIDLRSKRKPSVKHLKDFGSFAYLHIPKEAGLKISNVIFKETAQVVEKLEADMQYVSLEIPAAVPAVYQ
ncbi:uncharacterized protein LOC134949810 [Pseudophryne corroboree]|uniref:uncharacterized protein LOC134949810 n=1 Tax=Pseudophryne corroboree TaxID=495146 RepID=UPI003081BB1F